MYRYNLSQFMGLFKEALVGEGKIEHIKETLIQIIFENVSLGLLKAHRLLLGIVIIRDVLERVFAE